MATQWLRRSWLLAACASLLLAACGGGSVESQFDPKRVVAVGDAFSDLGQRGSRYTVNDGSVNNWSQYLAGRYDLPLVATVDGGNSYATGSARIASTPDAAGNPATPTVAQQVDAFLAAGGPRSGDLVLLGGGIGDVITQGRAVIDGAQSRDAALAAVGEAGRAYGALVRKVVDAGARHVAVVGSYNLGRSPWARETGQRGLLEDLSSRFNEQLLISIVDLGSHVLYIDAALYFNLLISSPADENLREAEVPVCTSVDPGEGIGTGPGQVDSLQCTTATLRDARYDEYLFADRVYPTPRGHRLFGEYAYDRIRDRW